MTRLEEFERQYGLAAHTVEDWRAVRQKDAAAWTQRDLLVIDHFEGMAEYVAAINLRGAAIAPVAAPLVVKGQDGRPASVVTADRGLRSAIDALRGRVLAFNPNPGEDLSALVVDVAWLDADLADLEDRFGRGACERQPAYGLIKSVVDTWRGAVQRRQAEQVRAAVADLVRQIQDRLRTAPRSLDDPAVEPTPRPALSVVRGSAA